MRFSPLGISQDWTVDTGQTPVQSAASQGEGEGHWQPLQSATAAGVLVPPPTRAYSVVFCLVQHGFVPNLVQFQSSFSSHRAHSPYMRNCEIMHSAHFICLQ